MEPRKLPAWAHTRPHITNGKENLTPEHKKPPEPLLLDAKELGRRLSIQYGTLLAWARKGLIPHYRLGALVRFDPVAIRAWIQQRQMPGASRPPGNDQGESEP